MEKNILEYVMNGKEVIEKIADYIGVESKRVA